MFFLRLLYHSFQRQPRRKLLAGIAVTLSVVMATAMITIANDVEDRMSRELRSVGANIVVRPAAASLDLSVPGTPLKVSAGDAHLNENDLPKVKQHFWWHNILGVTPVLNGSVDVAGRSVSVIGTWFEHPMPLNNETFVTGASKTHKWWHVDGSWPGEDSDQVLLGRRLAQAVHLNKGDSLQLANAMMRVSGVLSSGGAEDDAIIAPLHLAQRILGRPGQVDLVYVSALTKPEDEFARRDPKSMPPKVLERWMCSPYAGSIAYTIDQAFPSGHAEVVRAVAQSEGVVLSRISGLMLLITLCALVAAVMAVASSMATTLFERSAEIGLLRSLGATTAFIATLFLLEASILSVVSGVIGYLGGSLLARQISAIVFGTSVTTNPALLPLVILIAAAVTILGSLTAIRRALRVSPSIVLRGEAV
jgi:putative ABC transport system permease protein